MGAVRLVDSGAAKDEAEIRHGLEGNLCRCTGYQNIVAAVKLARKRTGAPETADNPN